MTHSPVRKTYILFYLTIFLICCNLPDNPPNPEMLADIQDIKLPESYESKHIKIRKVDLPSGIDIPEGYVLISSAYDIKYRNNDSTDFGNEFAEIIFTVDWEDIVSMGYLEDFQGFYLDETLNSWKPVYSTLVDPTTETVTLYTNHFTIFILTALTPSTDNVYEAPDCVANQIVSNYSDTGQIIPPDFIVLDENFEYYRDRDYYLRPWKKTSDPLYSIENGKSFKELGLAGAIGLATYNGGSAQYPNNQHKYYTGTDYLSFTAASDIEIFVMYDSRGGGSRLNFTNDASWLTSEGFSVRRDGGGNPYFIQTTDSVGYYSIYSRTYTTGDTVTLHGNWKGTTDTRINTNYWVIVKPTGCPTEDSGFNTFIPADMRPQAVSNLTARPDGSNIILEWNLPSETSNIDSIIIRRGTDAPPSNPFSGSEPFDIASTETSFTDSTAPTGTMVYYSLFTLTVDKIPSAPISLGIMRSGSNTEYSLAVKQLTPSASQGSINPESEFIIVFNQSLNVTSLTSYSLYLEQGGSRVNAKITYVEDDYTIKLIPDTNLVRGENCYLIITEDLLSTSGFSLGALQCTTYFVSETSLEITITSNIYSAIPVTLTGTTTETVLGTTLNLLAEVPAVDAPCTYTWYVNGTEEGSGATFTFETAYYGSGYYRIDVRALSADQTQGGSSTALVHITE